MAEKVEYLIETDFLFGLRPSDGLNRAVKRALQRNFEGELGLILSGASPIEANAVMASQGLAEERIGEAFSLFNVMMCKHRLERYSWVTISDVQEASNLRRKLRRLSFFDSLHAAISARVGLPILSSDPIYRDIGVKWVDLRGMARS